MQDREHEYILNEKWQVTCWASEAHIAAFLIALAIDWLTLLA